jgi:hypothetical protein
VVARLRVQVDRVVGAPGVDAGGPTAGAVGVIEGAGATTAGAGVVESAGDPAVPGVFGADVHPATTGRTVRAATVTRATVRRVLIRTP